MSKWADFVITKVRFNKERTHIEQVKRYRDNGSGLINEQIKKRQAVVNAINKGCTYVTSTLNENGEWVMGALVKVVIIDGVEYLRTVEDSNENNNLLNLPEF
jgi:hypothetical protein